MKARNGESSQGLGCCAGESISLTICHSMVGERLSPAQHPKPVRRSPIPDSFSRTPAPPRASRLQRPLGTVARAYFTPGYTFREPRSRVSLTTLTRKEVIKTCQGTQGPGGAMPPCARD